MIVLEIVNLFLGFQYKHVSNSCLSDVFQVAAFRAMVNIVTRYLFWFCRFYIYFGLIYEVPQMVCKFSDFLLCI